MGCPFKRENTNEKPYPGGSHPFVYLGQARGPFWLPCHEDKNYEGKGSNPETVSQCRGAAIFRANCNTGYERPSSLLKLEPDTENVFANEIEFFMHYIENESKEEVEKFFTKEFLDLLMQHEITKISLTKRIYKNEDK